MIPTNDQILFISGWIVGAIQTVFIISYLRGLRK